MWLCLRNVSAKNCSQRLPSGFYDLDSLSRRLERLKRRWGWSSRSRRVPSSQNTPLGWNPHSVPSTTRPGAPLGGCEALTPGPAAHGPSHGGVSLPEPRGEQERVGPGQPAAVAPELPGRSPSPARVPPRPQRTRRGSSPSRRLSHWVPLCGVAASERVTLYAGSEVHDAGKKTTPNWTISPEQSAGEEAVCDKGISYNEQPRGDASRGQGPLGRRRQTNAVVGGCQRRFDGTTL